ncbi:MAG: hypothetical protein AB7K09_12985 [Planctomycetota bacterium]
MDDVSTIRRQPDADDPTDPRRITAHGRAFVTFVYGLLRHQTFAVPAGASTDGLVVAFEHPEFVTLISRVLSTFALDSLARRAPPVPPEVLLEDGRIERFSPWDAELRERMVPGVNQRVIGLLAQLFLIASAATGRDETLQLDDTRDGGREIAGLARWLEGETTKYTRRSRKSSMVWANALSRSETSALTLASVLPERLFPRDDPVGPLDLLLLDSTIRAARDVGHRLSHRTADLQSQWSSALDRAVELSPLSFVLAEVDDLTSSRPSERRGVDACADAMLPLFSSGNHFLLRFLESSVVDAWVAAETQRLKQDDSVWAQFIQRFVDMVDAVIQLARESGHYSVLTVVPRFYAQFFQVFREEPWVERVRLRMGQGNRRRFSDRQRFADDELSLFGPLAQFAQLLDQIRHRAWAERSAEENWLVSQPQARTGRLEQRVRFCREKLALPFTTRKGG